MFTVKTTKKSTIVLANNFVVGTGYKRMLILAEAYGGKVDTDKKSKLAKITFGDTTSATEFVKQFTQEYTQAHKAYKQAQAELAWLERGSSSTKKLFDTKKTPSSSKKSKKAKGNGFDFDSVKGKTKSEKNKALHKMLVGMGIADSRTPEYKSVWEARPWAN